MSMSIEEENKKLRILVRKLKKKASDEARTCSNCERYMSRLNQRIEHLASCTTLLHDEKDYTGQAFIDFIKNGVY